MLGKIVQLYIDPRDNQFNHSTRRWSDKSQLCILGADQRFYDGYMLDARDASSNKLTRPPRIGQLVSFRKSKSGSRREAKDIRMLHAELATRDQLSAICAWSVNAQYESAEIERYFYRTPGLEKILDGRVCLVLGRKGTGKTAVIEHLVHEAKKNDNIRVDRFSLGDPEFPILYQRAKEMASSLKRYQLLWTYVVLVAVAQLIVDDPSTDAKTRDLLKKAVGTSSVSSNSFDRLVGWVRDINKKPAVRLAYNALSVAAQSNGVPLPLQSLDRKDAAESQADNQPFHVAIAELMSLLREIPKSGKSYYVLFDQLDEGYRISNDRDGGDGGEYFKLLEGLVLAATSVLVELRATNIEVRPIVFLRDDLYEAIPESSSKHMWDELALRLTWSPHDLNQMLALRLARAKDPKAQRFDFDQEWHNLFRERFSVWNVEVKVRGDGIPQFEAKLKDGAEVRSVYLDVLERTNRTPRDIIVAVREVANIMKAENVLMADDEIITRAMRKASEIYVSQSRSELSAYFPNPTAVLDALKLLPGHMFRMPKLVEALKYAKVITNDDDAENIARILAKFSVIANTKREGDAPRFVYLNDAYTFNSELPMVVHKGLIAGLGL